MAFPTFADFMSSAAILVIGLPVAYILSRVLKLRPQPIPIADPKREGTLVIWLIISLTAVVAAWEIYIHSFYIPAFQLYNHVLNNGQTVDIFDLLPFLLVYTSTGLLMVLAMRRSGQELGSIGLSKQNLGRMFALGLSLGTIDLVVTGSVVGGFVGVSTSLIYGLILFPIVGFVEEAIWRGYIQTRMIARIGKLRGLLFTSLLFALLWHFPVAYYTQASGDVLGGLAYAFMRFFPGLLYGYIMIRSQSMIPSSILHFFDDYNAILWR